MSTTGQALMGDEIDKILHDTRRRCTHLNTLARHGITPLTRAVFNERQILAAQDLAYKFYEAAASSGCDRGVMDDATDLIGAAIEGIRRRDFGDPPSKDAVRYMSDDDAVRLYERAVLNSQPEKGDR